mgnify:CR=1 FL=1
MMIDRVEKETGTLTAFINGAIGYVDPRLSNGETTGDITNSAHTPRSTPCVYSDR